MKHFTQIVKEHMWDSFLQDWQRRKLETDHDFKSFSIHGYEKVEFRQQIGIYHIQAQDVTTDELYEIKVLTVEKEGDKFPIVVLVVYGPTEIVEEFDCDGNSKSGQFILFGESFYFEVGDIVVTDSGFIGMRGHHPQMLQGAINPSTGTEYTKLCSCGLIYRLANADEQAIFADFMFVHDMKYDENEKVIEGMYE